MEVSPRGAEAFVRKPPADVGAVFVYGANRGLVRERARALVAGSLGGDDESFRLVRLSVAEVAEGGLRRLLDEALAISFDGGARVLWIEGQAEKCASVLSGYLEQLAAGALGEPQSAGFPFLVAEGGALPKRNKTVAEFSRAKHGAALACYGENMRDLVGLIDSHFEACGVERDAREALSSRLAPDRMLVRRELEKLSLYRGAENSARVSLAEVEAAVADNSDSDLDDLSFAVGGRNPKATRRALARLRDERRPGAVLLRACARHFLRLAEAAAHMQTNGGNPDGAMQSLRPPVFWQRQSAFRNQLNVWDAARLEAALSVLLEAETIAKSGRVPADAYAARRLLALSGAR